VRSGPVAQGEELVAHSVVEHGIDLLEHGAHRGVVTVIAGYRLGATSGGGDLLDGVVVEDGVFDCVHVPVGRGAVAFLAAWAEEVPVGAASPVGSLDDHAVLAALVVAVGAPQ
jgi:hypothetical protein